MKSPRAIVKVAGPVFAACMLLVPLALQAGETVGDYMETKLLASDGAAGDDFGYAVAISGDTAVIGANGDDELGDDSGSAYVFERQADGTWDEVAKLTASDGAEGDFFGQSVAISGDTAVIGAYRDNLGSYSGSAYVFERDRVDPTDWKQTAKLANPRGTYYFGYSVAISEDTAVIGGPALVGTAEVFERDPVDPAHWEHTASLYGDTYVYFGVSVGISGTTAVIGEYLDNNEEGSAYVFERQADGTWDNVEKLTASDGVGGDRFGVSVAISRSTTVIGAYGGDGGGAAYVFQRDPLDPANWIQTAKLTAADQTEDDVFGASVAISGDTLVIGNNEDDLNKGAAYVFERDPVDPTDWKQIAKLTAADGVRSDHFGLSVATSGDRAVIGAYLDDDLGMDSGSGYVYSLEDCQLDLALQPLTLRAGEELRVGIDLHHRRPITVTVPFLLWIEDAAGQVVAEKSSPPITMEPGDQRQLRLALNPPESMEPGRYRVVVGVEKMQQGIAWASQEFEIVE